MEYEYVADNSGAISRPRSLTAPRLDDSLGRGHSAGSLEVRMLDSLPLMDFLLVSGGVFYTLAFLCSRWSGLHSEQQEHARLPCTLGAAALALASLVGWDLSFAKKPAVQASPHEFVEQAEGTARKVD